MLESKVITEVIVVSLKRALHWVCNVSSGIVRVVGASILTFF